MKKVLLIIIAVIAVAIGGVVIYVGRRGPEINHTSSSANGSSQQCKNQSKSTLSAAITDIDKIDFISSGKLVFDPRFVYLSIKDGQRIPVYAPASAKLTRIFYKKRLDQPASAKPDYDLVFVADCHASYRLNHITDPITDITALTPITEPLQIGSDGIIDLTDAKITPKQELAVTAGQQIGTTTGTDEAHNWDFSVYIDNRAVCPFEQYAEPLRSNWLAKLGDTNGVVPGTTCDISPLAP